MRCRSSLYFGDHCLGLVDPDISAFKHAGGWFTVFDEPPISSQLHQGREYIRRLSLCARLRWTRILPAAAALDRILEDTGYLAFAATVPGSVDAGDVLHAVDPFVKWSRPREGLADAADSLESDDEATNEVESLPLEPGRTELCG